MLKKAGLRLRYMRVRVMLKELWLLGCVLCVVAGGKVLFYGINKSRLSQAL